MLVLYKENFAWLGNRFSVLPGNMAYSQYVKNTLEN